ncbi:MAG: hypothetical protein COA42_00190 [Alteromonadaceae bacterium]|nr:MAG: hypothetical protein COA42_00190 [Alteromonadaceae bacterium]
MAIDVKQNEKWAKEAAQLKKLQVNFSFVPQVDRALRHEAVDLDMTPSNLLREKLGLTSSKTVRQRLGVSLDEGDFHCLAERYELDPNDRNAIKRRATEEIQKQYQSSLDQKA